MVNIASYKNINKTETFITRTFVKNVKEYGAFEDMGKRYK